MTTFPVTAAPVGPLRQRLIDDMSVRRVSAETQRNSLRRFWKNDQDSHRPVIGADVSGRMARGQLPRCLLLSVADGTA